MIEEKAVDTLKHEHIYSGKISFAGGLIFWFWFHLFVGEGGLFSIELDVMLQYEGIQCPFVLSSSCVEHFVQQGILQLDIEFFARGLCHYTAFDRFEQVQVEIHLEGEAVVSLEALQIVVYRNNFHRVPYLLVSAEIALKLEEMARRSWQFFQLFLRQLLVILEF